MRSKLLSLGPSSNVNAIARRERQPRYTDGPKICADQPLTAYTARPATPANAAAPRVTRKGSEYQISYILIRRLRYVLIPSKNEV